MPPLLRSRTPKKTNPEQTEVVNTPTTTKRTLKRKASEASSSNKPASKIKRATKVKSEPIEASHSQSSAEGAVESQSETKPNVETKKTTGAKRGPKPKTAVKEESDSQTEPKPKRTAAKDKAKTEDTDKKETKKKVAGKGVEPKINAKEKRRKIKASEIPGFSSLSHDMTGRVVRVLTQRIFVLSRSQLDHHKEVFEIIGSTGSTYTVNIADKMTCSCIDYRFKRIHCKHILTVLLKVYKLHLSNPLIKSLTTTEHDRKAAIEHNSHLVDPSILVSEEDRQKIQNYMTNNLNQSDRPKAERRPLDTSDCPVCFEEFEPENINFIDFCYTCGNNIHTQCLGQWISAKGGEDRATCVYCRAKWIKHNATPHRKTMRDIDSDHKTDGFVNFSNELGISRKRDQSSYGIGYLDYIE